MKAIMDSTLNEHHKLNKFGELEGLWTVDINKGTFTHDDLWGRIDQIIYEYYKLHPIEMEAVMKQNRHLKDGQLRKYGLGESKDMELRHHVRVPVGLLRTLEAYSPELFATKANYHKFIRRYKGLCAHE